MSVLIPSEMPPDWAIEASNLHDVDPYDPAVRTAMEEAYASTLDRLGVEGLLAALKEACLDAVKPGGTNYHLAAKSVESGSSAA